MLPQDGPFHPIANESALDAVFDRSAREPLLLFLHAPNCPIGLNAFWEMKRSGESAALVDVTRQRTLTRAIEQRTGVRHESPRVMVLHDGAALWHASHYDITAEAVQHALRAAERQAA